MISEVLIIINMIDIDFEGVVPAVNCRFEQ